MVQIRVDLQQMARFCQKLFNFRDRLNRERTAFITNVSEARAYWTDEDYTMFSAECRKIEAEIARFDAEIVKRIDYLLVKEQAGRAALGFNN